MLSYWSGPGNFMETNLMDVKKEKKIKDKFII